MSENDPAKTKDVDEASARIRTQSECSITSDDGNCSTSTGKRIRTASPSFMVTGGLTSASPPKFVSLEEIMQAANGMKDMALVHQIVVDKDFRLEPYEPSDNTLHKIVKDTVHKAFWDQLQKNYTEDPPNYEPALNLLEEIRERLSNLLLPQHTKLKQQINEILDRDLVDQQARQGILDLKHYSQYIISVMGKLCAPVRDEKIKELTETADIIERFKGIMDVLNLMTLDMANFTIQITKPDIIAHSVELERKKFADFLAIQPDGLAHTRKWLLEYIDSSVTVPLNTDRNEFIRVLNKDIFIKACISLLEWPDDDPYPETFMLDESRLADLQLRMDRLIIVGTVILIVVANVGPHLYSLASFKQAVKVHTSIIMDSFKSDKDLESLLPNVAVQVLKDIDEAQTQHSLPKFNESQKKSLEELILDIPRTDNKIRVLVRQRVKEFLQLIIASSTAAPEKVPSGLTIVQRELIELAGQFLKIVVHNGTVFCNYYYDIIDLALPKSSTT